VGGRQRVLYRRRLLELGCTGFFLCCGYGGSCVNRRGRRGLCYRVFDNRVYTRRLLNFKRGSFFNSSGLVGYYIAFT
jgi:hypothetical protein